MPQTRTQLERQYLGQFSLVSGAATRQTFNFPLGELYYAMNLRIGVRISTAAAPSGNTAYTDVILELINQIQLDVDRDGTLIRAPGKALHRIGQIKKGTAPNVNNASFNPNTASTNFDMDVHIPIFFADYRMVRPEDTCLATDRYTQMQLLVNVGIATDTLSTIGTQNMSLSNMTCDVELLKYQGPIPKEARPRFVQKIMVEGSPSDTSTGLSIGLTRSPSRALKRLYINTANLAASARPWSGNGNNAILGNIQVESDQKPHDQNRRASQIRDWNKLEFEQETWPAGLHVLNYAGDGSNYSALSTGDKAKLEVQYTQATSGVPAGTNNLCVVSEAIEALRE